MNSGHAVASGGDLKAEDGVEDMQTVSSHTTSLLGVKSKPLTALQRRKKKVKESAGSVKLSHLQDEEDGDEEELGS